MLYEVITQDVFSLPRRRRRARKTPPCPHSRAYLYLSKRKGSLSARITSYNVCYTKLLRFADRLAALPPYLFAGIDKAKAAVAARGVDIISLGIGDPDMPTPDFIIEALHEAAKKPANHQYPSYVGMLSFRQAVADWYGRRFGVSLEAARNNFV